jgi:hypothetical protein
MPSRARPPPARHWRYSNDPLPTPADALNEPFAAFPSWFLRIECERCGKMRMVNETHARWRTSPLRDALARMRHGGCGGLAAKAKLLTGIDGVMEPSGAADRAALMKAGEGMNEMPLTEDERDRAAEHRLKINHKLDEMDYITGDIIGWLNDLSDGLSGMAPDEHGRVSARALDALRERVADDIHKMRKVLGEVKELLS